MAFRLFISDYTHRSEEDQISVLRKQPQLADAPIYRPQDFPTMFRKTQRVENVTYYASSVACFAPSEDAFKNLLAGCRKKRAYLASIDEGFAWSPNQSTTGAVKAWKAARVNGSAKIGADISAKNRKADSKKACDAIKALWPLPNKVHETCDLLRKANEAIGKKGKLHYRTAVQHLGRRPIEQANYQAEQKRKAGRQKAKAA